MALAMNTQPAPNTRYNQFSANTGRNAQNYLSGKALNSPIDTSQFKTYGADLYGKLFGGGSTLGGGSGGGFNLWSGFGGPDDPNLKGHLANLTGGTRNLASKAVSDAAYAGPNRGGSGMVGGSDPRAAGAYQLVKAMGDDYGNRYKTAADLTYRDNAMGADNARSAMSLLSGIFGNDAGLQKSEADFRLGQGNIGVQLNQQDLTSRKGAEDFEREKYFDDQNYARGEYDRTFNREQQRIAANQAQSSRLSPQVDPKTAEIQQMAKRYWNLAEKGPSYYSNQDRYMMENMAPILSSYYGVNPATYPKGGRG